MVVVPNVNFIKEKKVAQIGDLEINKKESKTIAWPAYLGGIVAVAGIVMVVAARKQA